MPDINPTELVDERLKLALENSVTGFNSCWAVIIAARPGKSLPTVMIDWTDISSNYLRHPLASEDEALSIFSPPLGLCQYTSECQSPREDRTLGGRFDGTVLAHLDFFIRREGGVTNFEAYAEAFKHALINAVLQSVTDPSLGWFESQSVGYNGDYQCIPDLSLQTDSGYMQRIPMELRFTVHI